MDAYAAAISLKKTIKDLVKSSGISILPHSLEILESAQHEVRSWIKFLLILDSSKRIDDRERMEAFLDELKNPSIDRAVTQFVRLAYHHRDFEILGTVLDINSDEEFRAPIREYASANYHDLETVNDLDGVAVDKFENVLESLLYTLIGSPARCTVEDLARVKQHTEIFLNIIMKTVKEEVNLSPSQFQRIKKLIAEIKGLADEEYVKFRLLCQRFNTKRSRERANALDGLIREAACKLEDALEFHVSGQILSQSETHSSPFSLDLQLLNPDINSFTQSVKKLKEDYIHEVCKTLEEEEEEEEENGDNVVPSRTDFSGKTTKSKMVGYTDELSKIIDDLTVPSFGIRYFALSGMAGIGKTTFAKEIFEHPSILSHFHHRVWVTVGPISDGKKILRRILAQLNPNNNRILTEADDTEQLFYSLFASIEDMRYFTKIIPRDILAQLNRNNEIILTEEDDAEQLFDCFEGMRFLIVLEDVWDINIDVICLAMRRMFRNDDDEIRILLTTTLKCPFDFLTNYEMHLLNEEESWNLLRTEVFGEETTCPSHLEIFGKKIAEDCDGLPLTIVTVASLLTQGEKTPEHWRKTAEKKNSIFKDAYDEVTKILYPNYNELPSKLKTCFLYMGVFPQKYEIRHSELIILLTAEGFLENDEYCFDKLISINLVILCNKRFSYYDKIKTCRAHSAFWELCYREANKVKFFHVINSYDDGLAEGIKSQRRLCIHKNVLLGMKDVYNAIATCSTARSLLCTGPYHPYPVPIYFGQRLLRVLNALTIRLYEFPMEVLKLVQLRYLALTCNEKLPPSISKLWNLQYLIVRQHLSIIKLCEDESYLPMDIWDMKELKHLQVMGSNLPDPCGGVVLPNLLTLLDVGAHSCTKGVFEGLPNLTKLGVRIELAIDADEHLCCFDHISHLNNLETLKCVILNPKLTPPPPLSSFPKSLRKLTLSGFGYPWEEMKVIASLPYLRVLKLQCFAFRGPKWEGDLFPMLGSLLIEDSDLVQIGPGEGFNSLDCLRLKNCYKLEVISPFGEGIDYPNIELVDCNPLAVICAKRMQENNDNLKVHVHYSWDDDGKTKS